MEDRIIELETKMAYQDHTIESLNDVVTKQQKQIDALEFQIQQIKGQMMTLTEMAKYNIPSEKPPHY